MKVIAMISHCVKDDHIKIVVLQGNCEFLHGVQLLKPFASSAQYQALCVT